MVKKVKGVKKSFVDRYGNFVYKSFMYVFLIIFIGVLLVTIYNYQKDDLIDKGFDEFGAKNEAITDVFYSTIATGMVSYIITGCVLSLVFFLVVLLRGFYRIYLEGLR